MGGVIRKPGQGMPPLMATMRDIDAFEEQGMDLIQRAQPGLDAQTAWTRFREAMYWLRRAT